MQRADCIYGAQKSPEFQDHGKKSEQLLFHLTGLPSPRNWGSGGFLTSP